MTRVAPRHHHGQLVAQILIALLVMAIVLCAPPARGAMLILSLSGDDAGQIARWATRHDARLLGAGPVPHSLVVVGSRDALLGVTLRHHGLLLTGAFAGCGEGLQN